MKLGKPFVAFGRTRRSARHAWVDPDFEAAVEGAVERLVALGHRRIGLALPRLRTNYLDLVETGYRRAMRAHGLTVDDNGTCAARRASAAVSKPRTRCWRPIRGRLRFSSANSMQAVAIYRRLGEAGLRPGRDISILGLLPEARAQYLIPTLTTYQTDWTEIGRRLADAVIVRNRRCPRSRAGRRERPRSS